MMQSYPPTKVGSCGAGDAIYLDADRGVTKARRPSLWRRAWYWLRRKPLPPVVILGVVKSVDENGIVEIDCLTQMNAWCE